MPITVYSNVILSNGIIHAGVKGRQIRRNQRVATDSGQEFVNVVWSQTLREFEIATVPLRREDWIDLETLYEVTDAGGFGFLLLDPKDHVVTSSVGVLASLGGGSYQLYRRYLHSSGRYKDRKITRPMAAGLEVFEGAGGSLSFTLDADTGIISGVSGTPASWSGKFYTPVHFISDSIEWSMVVSGPDPDGRFLSGPSLVLQEIRE